MGLRTILTADDAQSIYLMKVYTTQHAPTESLRQSHLRQICKFLVSVHHVSPKTIRDVWNHKTWVHVTQPLWSYDRKPVDPLDDIRDPRDAYGDVLAIEKLSSDPFHFDWVEPSTPF